MLSLFRNQAPRSIVLLLFFLILSRLPWLILSIPLPGNVNSLPGQYKDEWLLGISMIIILLQAIWITNIVNNSNLFSERNFVPGLVWIAITIADNGYMVPGNPIALSLIICGLMHIMMTAQHESAGGKETFNAGLLTGIGAAIYPPFIVLFPFNLVAMYNLKSFRINQYFLSFLGLFTPLFWVSSYHYLTDRTYGWWDSMQVHFGLAYFEQDLFLGIKSGILIFFGFLGLFSLSGSLKSAGFRRKKNVRILITLLLGVSAAFLLSREYPFAFSLMLMPIVTVLISMLLLRINKRLLAEVLFGIFAFSLLTIQILSSIK